MTMPALTAADFDMYWNDEVTFPFTESEDAVIMAYGHVDKADLVQAVRVYDDLCNPGYAHMITHDPEDVYHLWAVRTGAEGENAEGWYITWGGITADTPNAFPVSIIRER